MTPEAERLFSEAFGAPWRRGPIPTALGVLERDLRRQAAWHSPLRLPEAAERGGTETPLNWSRELRACELERAYIVAFDKHAAYLGVLGSLELGIGEPIREQWPGGLAAHESVALRLLRRRPGYWRVSCAFPPPDGYLPDPLGRDRASAQRQVAQWVTTPTLELALGCGLEVDVFEAVTWPRHARLLRSFGVRCAAARRELTASADPAAAEALRELKHVYGPLLGGFLARRADRALSPRPPWYRPDWRHHIIAKARANLLRNCAFWQCFGFAPVAIWNDAVYFATDTPGITCARQAGIPLDASLGGYTLDAEYPLPRVVSRRRLDLTEALRLSREAA